MGNVSRPLIALLVATVAFFALWIVALKPSSGTGTAGTSSQNGPGAYQHDINAAEGRAGCRQRQHGAPGRR